MRALVLAGGRGSRLGEVTHEQNKCLLTCGDVPVVERVVSSAVALPEITEVVLVVGYRGEELVEHFRRRLLGVPMVCVRQPQQLGVVDAIECARPRVDDDDVLLLLGDEFMLRPRFGEFIADFRDRGLGASVGSFATPDLEQIRKTYTFDYGDDGLVRTLVEKPHAALSSHMGTGAVLFRKGMLAFTEAVRPHPLRGQRELVGILQMMIESHIAVSWFDVCDGFVNVNTSDDLDAARSLASVPAC